MPKPATLLLGPETLWIIFYVLVVLVIKATGSPTKAMDGHWENLGFIAPLVGIPLTFALYYVPGVEHNWLLPRVWLAGLVGAHFVLDKGLNAHSQQGPGVGTIYLMGIVFVFVLLVAGSIFVKIRF